ncbi:diguanylate cyclase domain-containing protein [Microcoleus sp. FACHB-672]|uniref:sensor domain-containing diguanylate cyclase n=1 Tax=Microcoleus sp. FACHB-672 TaxID=2692825 RepID=UPI0016856420|nr:diguanylate cyclase [Microcoleus sp. FACHB-672]MBD2039674.1 diguanylate cyclase [Microcoleus sp. FACHB-672]
MTNEILKVEEKFGVLDRVPVGVCVLREDFVVLFWNNCLEDWTQIPKNEILGTNIHDHFPHLHHPKYTTRLKLVFAGSPPAIFSAHIHKYLIPAPMLDGQCRIQESTVTAVPALLGKGFYGLIVIQDVTDLTHRIKDYRAMRDQAVDEVKERQRVEQELRSSQHFIQKMADAIPYLMYIYDLVEQQNVYANHQITGILGYTPEEVQEMGQALFFNLMHPEDLTRLPAHQGKLIMMQDGEVMELEYRMKHRSGEWRWLRGRELVFSRTDEGVPKQILGTAQDITEYKWAEEVVRQQNERERLIRVIAQHIRQSLNLQEILNTTVREVRQFLQTDRVVFFRWQSPDKGVVIVESVGSNWTPLLGKEIYDPCFAQTYTQLYQQGRIRAIENIYTADLSQCYIDLLKPFEVIADLTVPILQGVKSQEEWEKGLSEQCNYKSIQEREEVDLLPHHRITSAPELWGLIIAHHCSGSRQWQPLEIDLLKQLATQVAIAIQQAELYEQLQAANEELQRLATSDGLTQLANRRRFDEYLEFEWRQLARKQEPLSLILCDVDFFKSYNDTYGHQAGDDCLRLVAAAIRDAGQRTADLVARYGGEEFALVLPHTDVTGAACVAKEVRSKLNNLRIPHSGSQVSQYVTVSMGVASTIPQHDRTPAMLIAIADKALYQAKAEGRDRMWVAQA